MVDISLVICTRNRAEQLGIALQSLEKLATTGLHWELVLVDNGSTDRTHAVLQAFAARSPLAEHAAAIRVVQESRAGLSFARNTGWQAASGEIIAFTDDDCYPQSDFLQATVACFAHWKADYMGGRVLLHDPEDAPVTIQLLDEVRQLPPRSRIEAGVIHGANFSFRRSVLEALRGFDTRFGAGTYIKAGEDTEIMMRASAKGYAGVYDPRMVVSHHHGRRHPEDLKKLRKAYAMGRGALSAKAVLASSELRKVYLQHWYWRLHHLLRDGRFGEITEELRGAAHFFRTARSLRHDRRSPPP